MGKIRRISIHGFKSIKSLTDFELRDLNIVIGANGAGKSNLMQLFEMLFSMHNITVCATQVLILRILRILWIETTERSR